jgi:hypothetical protein
VGTLIAIDDTPLDLTYCISENNRLAAKKYFEKYGLMPGKGMYVDLLVNKIPNVKKIFHEYMVIYEVA